MTATDNPFGYLLVHFIEDPDGYAEKIYMDLSDGDKFAVHSLCVIGGKTNNDNGITDKGLHRFARKGRARTVDSLGIVGAEIGDRFGKNFNFDFALKMNLLRRSTSS